MGKPQSILAPFKRLFSQPVTELGRFRASLRYAGELAWHVAVELRLDHAAEMAAALTYRTLFSLIPLTVLALLLFNAFGGIKNVGGEVQDLINKQLGLSSLVLPTDTPPTDTGEAIDQPDDSAISSTQPTPRQQAQAEAQAQREMRARVDNIFAGLTEQVSKISFGKVGIIGLALFIWGAISLIVTIEQTFNRIYDCPTGRPWHMRIAIYWAVITLGPLLLFLSLYLTRVFLGWAGTLSGVTSWAVGQLSHAGALFASWLLLFLLFSLLPNTRVQRRSALIGSFVTALLYELGKWGFGLYVARAVPYSKLYGALGLVPLFLLWLYITWLVVLFGLELTYTLQAMRGRKFKHSAVDRAIEAAGNPQWLVPILVRIARAFDQGGAVASDEIAGDLGLPLRPVNELVGRLESEGLVHQAQLGKQGQVGFALSMPPEKIPLARVLDLARRMTLVTTPKTDTLGWDYLTKLVDVQINAAGETTLKTILAQPHSR